MDIILSAPHPIPPNLHPKTINPYMIRYNPHISQDPKIKPNYLSPASQTKSRVASIPHRYYFPSKAYSCWQILGLSIQNIEIRKLQKMSCEASENSVANFIQKSFEILENKQYESIIHWMANGREFAIKEIDEFQDHILPKFFRHRNINSFIRQLNMYGFHKSRKDPSKNIFSHPFFLRGQAQLLHLVKRKIKIQESREEEVRVAPLSPAPKKKNSENVEPVDLASKKSLHSFTLISDTKEHKSQKTEKEVLPTKTEIAGNSLAYLSYKSFGLAMEISPFKGLIEKSCVMDSNPELYMKMQSHGSMWQCGEGQPMDDEDNISIEDEIERERRVFQNRRSGVTILQTCNLLEDMDYQI